MNSVRRIEYTVWLGFLKSLSSIINKTIESSSKDLARLESDIQVASSFVCFHSSRRVCVCLSFIIDIRIRFLIKCRKLSSWLSTNEIKKIFVPFESPYEKLQVLFSLARLWSFESADSIQGLDFRLVIGIWHDIFSFLVSVIVVTFSKIWRIKIVLNRIKKIMKRAEKERTNRSREQTTFRRCAFRTNETIITIEAATELRDKVCAWTIVTHHRIDFGLRVTQHNCVLQSQQFSQCVKQTFAPRFGTIDFDKNLNGRRSSKAETNF